MACSTQTARSHPPWQLQEGNRSPANATAGWNGDKNHQGVIKDMPVQHQIICLRQLCHAITMPHYSGKARDRKSRLPICQLLQRAQVAQQSLADIEKAVIAQKQHYMSQHLGDDAHYRACETELAVVVHNLRATVDRSCRCAWDEAEARRRNGEREGGLIDELLHPSKRIEPDVDAVRDEQLLFQMNETVMRDDSTMRNRKAPPGRDFYHDFDLRLSQTESSTGGLANDSQERLIKNHKEQSLSYNHDQEGAASQTQPTLTDEELRQAQADALEEEIAEMAQQLKASTVAMNSTLKYQTTGLGEMEDLASSNLDKVTNVTKNVKEHLSRSWTKSIAKFTMFFSVLATFVALFMVIKMVRKRKNACLFYCQFSTYKEEFMHENHRQSSLHKHRRGPIQKTNPVQMYTFEESVDGSIAAEVFVEKRKRDRILANRSKSESENIRHAYKDVKGTRDKRSTTFFESNSKSPNSADFIESTDDYKADDAASFSREQNLSDINEKEELDDPRQCSGHQEASHHVNVRDGECEDVVQSDEQMASHENCVQSDGGMPSPALGRAQSHNACSRGGELDETSDLCDESDPLAKKSEDPVNEPINDEQMNILNHDVQETAKASDGQTNIHAEENSQSAVASQQIETKIKHAAATGDDVQLRRLLLNHPLAANVADLNGWYPIHEASRGGFVDSVKSLVDAGVDINTRTNFGKGGSSLWWALTLHGEGHPVVEELERLGGLSISPE